MKINYLTICLLLLITGQGQAQEYQRSVGIRGGVTSGITYRQFLNPELAYEGILSFRNEGMQFTILRQNFEPAYWQLSDGFFLCYGYGGHVGFSNRHSFDFFFREFHHAKQMFSPLIGMDGYVGLEYHFPQLPLLVGLDYKPFFEMTLYEFFQFSVWDVAFTLKYSF